MPQQRRYAKGALAGAAAAMALTAGVAPGVAAAQSGQYPPAPGQYADGCHSDRTGGVVLGALIGAGVGALLGSNIAASGHRGDGAALGAGVGAVGGGVAGSSVASNRCQDGPPPPPPPPGYYHGGANYGENAPPPHSANTAQEPQGYDNESAPSPPGDSPEPAPGR